ncbi:MAG: hypothetical protein AAGM45_02980, partial [Cyanobacteria bacterium J06588_5]
TFENPTPAEGDLFGNVVAIEGDALLVGAVGDDDGGDNSGAAYLFESSQSTASQDLTYVSFDSSGEIADLRFKNDDILAFNPETADWSMYLDGSDIGLRDTDIDAFDILADGSVVFSVSTTTTLADIGTVGSADLVRFIPTSTGSDTVGSFELYFQGEDVGLSTCSENIDALDVLPDGRLVISTTGDFQVTNDKAGKDDDLLLFTPSSLGETTEGAWTSHLGSSELGVNGVTEDINGVWVDENSAVQLTAKGSLDIFTPRGVMDEALGVLPRSLGVQSQDTMPKESVSLLWEDPFVALEEKGIDGFAKGPFPGFSFSGFIEQ